MAPPVVDGQQLAQRGEQVGLAAGAGLDHREAGGRMRHPDMQQTITRGGLLKESMAVLSEVIDLFPRAGLDANLLGMHGRTVIVFSFPGGCRETAPSAG